MRWLLGQVSIYCKLMLKLKDFSKNEKQRPTFIFGYCPSSSILPALYAADLVRSDQFYFDRVFPVSANPGGSSGLSGTQPCLWFRWKTRSRFSGRTKRLQWVSSRTKSRSSVNLNVSLPTDKSLFAWAAPTTT